MKEFNSIGEFFNILDEAGVNYLVLRNYENFLKPEFYVEEHADIDLLCDDSRRIIELEGVQPFHRKSPSDIGDGIHYRIHVNGDLVSLDLREVGDGYYCEKWERELLDRKVKQDCFFVMCAKDYFFTLVYHAILQKRQLSYEYKLRLSEMAEKLGYSFKDASEQSFLAILEHYMRDNGYVFTYSRDYMVPNRFELVDSSMVKRNTRLRIRHLFFEMKVAVIEMLVNIKHFLMR